eukprot:CAMPEP_0174289448 /NCGR_PEP_ID=MMETSP0809-20121228/25087_1 /TAXON_ID=73025 ORGANISM="Eutreptiella gymnastica-like, Strain CCMP1594" /NCGR_SAMPLE_ID=MMETSP0809 /ASSEMBLY_ACC=CAM_ASM_000658 /LENGTH=254 /DNA_ID=CAMNT_0015387415 /DNA_START=1147 /DNA_END=1910 /DNA_ORIENTATION=-
MALQATIRMRMIARPRTEQNMEENHVSELSDTSTGPTDQMSLGARLPELLLSKAPTPPREREVRGRDARVAPLSSQQGKGPLQAFQTDTFSNAHVDNGHANKNPPGQVRLPTMRYGIALVPLTTKLGHVQVTDVVVLQHDPGVGDGPLVDLHELFRAVRSQSPFDRQQCGHLATQIIARMVFHEIRDVVDLIVDTDPPVLHGFVGGQFLQSELAGPPSNGCKIRHLGRAAPIGLVSVRGHLVGEHWSEHHDSAN